MPVILSILLSLRVDLNLEHSAKTFMYAEALVDKAIWEYVTHSGIYSDLALTANVQDTDSEATKPPLDTRSARSKMLTQRLVDISEQYLSGVHSSGQPGLNSRSKVGIGLRQLWGNYFRNARVQDSEMPGNKDSRKEPRSSSRGEEYVALRLQKQNLLWSSAARKAEVELIFFKMFAYVCGAGGTVLSLLGFESWVTVTTALLTAFAMWNKSSPVEERLRRARAVTRSLKNIEMQWQAVPTERRSQQAVIDKLVHRGETAILGGLEPPPVPDKVAASEILPLDS
jgi:hypothetical protein